MKHLVTYISWVWALLVSVLATAQCDLKNDLAEALFSDSKLVTYFAENDQATEAYQLLHEVHKASSTEIADLNLVIRNLTEYSPAQLKTIVTNAGGFQAWKNVANAGSDLASYVNTLMNKNIRNAILDVAESRIVAQKYFNRIKQNPSNYLSDYTLHLNDFDNWYNNVFKSNLFEAHHVIPKNVLRDNPNLQSILDWARNNNKTWDFGDIDNGIMLQKRRKNNLGEVVGDHANHPSYDTDVSDKIDDIFNESNGNISDAYDDFVDFVNDLKTELNSQVVEGDRIVNNLIVP